MEPVDINFSTQMRDPTGDAARFVQYHAFEFEMLNDTDLTRWQAGSVISSIKKRGVALYSRGDSVSILASRFEDDLPCLLAQSQRVLDEELGSRSVLDRAQYGPITPRNRTDFGYLALALLLGRDALTVRELVRAQSKRSDQRLYVADLLLIAFDAAWMPAKKYVRDKSPWSADHWAAALVRVLAAPPEHRSLALHRYMARWGSLMKPYGWKPVRDFSPEAAKKRGELESLFGDFAFEAALAVCAYDIDDSSFRDHPYYPRDLVAHYRAHIRHTRDAWRGEGVGAGVPVQAPPLPQRADLAKSKRKGLARWLELVADGDVDALEAVLDAHGKARKVADVSALACLLGEQGMGVHADLRDDETLLGQLDQLAQHRGLGEFNTPDSLAEVSGGFDLCEALLADAEPWFLARGHRLLVLGNDDDAWAAVLVRSAYAEELQSLGQTLGIPMSTGAFTA